MDTKIAFENPLDELADLKAKYTKLREEYDSMKPDYIMFLKQNLRHSTKNLQKLIDLGIDCMNDPDVINIANSVVLNMRGKEFDPFGREMSLLIYYLHVGIL